MELSALFEQSVADSKNLPEKPSNDTLLNLYSLYKQATVGDNTGEAPGGFDFVARAKYDAWMSQSGKSKDVAMTEYVKLIEKLKA